MSESDTETEFATVHVTTSRPIRVPVDLLGDDDPSADELRERAEDWFWGWPHESLQNEPGPSTDDIAVESVTLPSESTVSELEENWPYEHVDPGEVTRDLTYQQAKALRQELEDLRSTLEDWACDECGDRDSVCTKGGTQLCRVCAGFEEAEP